MLHLKNPNSLLKHEKLQHASHITDHAQCKIIETTASADMHIHNEKHVKQLFE